MQKGRDEKRRDEKGRDEKRWILTPYHYVGGAVSEVVVREGDSYERHSDYYGA